MKCIEKFNKFLPYLLGILLAFGALNAFGGGYYGMSGAKDIPLEWLDGSPFKSYFIPSLILFTIVGGSFLAASIANFKKHKYARQMTFAAMAIVFIWLSVQILIIGYTSWMQSVTAIFAIVTTILTALTPSSKI